MSDHKKQKTGHMTYSNTRYTDYKGTHIWKINDFFTKCLLENKKCLESSKFKVAGCERIFFMKLFPKGHSDDDTVVSLFICVDEGSISVTCEFSLVDTTGRVVNKLRFQNSKIARDKGWGFPNFISRDTLQKQKLVLLPQDKLTVSCVVTIYGKPKVSPSSCVASTVIEDLASLFDRKEGADVLLKVGDESIPAHKSILICRSPVFSAMFKSDMREGNSGEVQVRDIDRDVLVALLSFFYTDRISISEVGFALKLLVAADRYAVQSLQSRCAQYLEENLSAANVFDIFSVAEACRSKELCRKCVLLIEREVSLSHILTQMDSSPHLIAVMKEHLNEKQNSN